MVALDLEKGHTRERSETNAALSYRVEELSLTPKTIWGSQQLRYGERTARGSAVEVIA
jgi:hypothetical protein